MGVDNLNVTGIVNPPIAVTLSGFGHESLIEGVWVIKREEYY